MHSAGPTSAGDKLLLDGSQQASCLAKQSSALCPPYGAQHWTTVHFKCKSRAEDRVVVETTRTRLCLPSAPLTQPTTCCFTTVPCMALCTCAGPSHHLAGTRRARSHGCARSASESWLATGSPSTARATAAAAPDAGRIFKTLLAYHSNTAGFDTLHAKPCASTSSAPIFAACQSWAILHQCAEVGLQTRHAGNSIAGHARLTTLKSMPQPSETPQQPCQASRSA